MIASLVVGALSFPPMRRNRLLVGLLFCLFLTSVITSIVGDHLSSLERVPEATKPGGGAGGTSLRLNLTAIAVWGASALSALGVLIVAHRLSRAAKRSRRGLCPACGYDLRATPERCPECGRQGDKMNG
jgi:hypothetical protein